LHRAVIRNRSRYAADSVRAGNAASAVTIFYCAAVDDIPRHAADIVDATGNAAGAVAVFHRAAVGNNTRHAADRIPAGNAAGDIAVLHRAGKNIPRYAAGTPGSGDACALDADIFHRSAGNNSEQTLIVDAGAVNRQPGDFLIVAVKGSLEWFVVVSDRRPACAAVRAGIARKVKVVLQLQVDRTRVAACNEFFQHARVGKRRDFGKLRRAGDFQRAGSCARALKQLHLLLRVHKGDGRDGNVLRQGIACADLRD
jgi:hypothetical protein